MLGKLQLSAGSKSAALNVNPRQYIYILAVYIHNPNNNSSKNNNHESSNKQHKKMKNDPQGPEGE